jgi:hypothetical protein
MKSPIKLALLAAVGLSAVTAHAETYAVMVGIGDYPDPVGADGKPLRDDKGNVVNLDLAGPVNDVKTYKDLLVNKHGVKPDNIKLVLDKNANEKGFVDNMRWLFGTAKPGDQIIFVYSGHGTQIKAEDEEDGKEEAIVLADNMLVPGDLFGELAKSASKAGLNATFVFDSCFSGGMSRDVVSFNGNAGQARNKFVLENVSAKMKRLPKAKGTELKAVVKAAPTQEAGSYAFLFGGREDQTTTDLDFKDPDQPDHGLFTLVLAMALEKLPDAPVEDLMKAVAEILKEKGFTQVPQFEFSSAARGQKPFFLK